MIKRKTKEFLAKFDLLGIVNKKVLVFFGILIMFAVGILFVSAVGWKMHEGRNSLNKIGASGNNFDMMKGRNEIYSMPISRGGAAQFAVPEDASKHGEIAIEVSDLEMAKRVVSSVAAKGNGSVYATFISYASGNLKSGSIVVKIPAENFDATFQLLKSVGSKVIQESTQQISPRNVAYPMMAPAATTSVQEKTDADVTTTKPVINSKDAASEVVVLPASPAPSIARLPQQQTVQDKGYIRIVLADYGKTPINNIDGAGSAQGRRGLWIVFVAESLLLAILFVVLVLMLRKIFRDFRSLRKKKSTVHVVRQIPKAHKRVVKVQRKR